MAVVALTCYDGAEIGRAVFMGQIRAGESTLKDGRLLVIRTAETDDALATLDLYRSVVAEGRFTLLEPDELKRDEKGERGAISADLKAPQWVRVIAEVDHRVVGMARVRGGRAQQDLPLRRSRFGVGL